MFEAHVSNGTSRDEQHACMLAEMHGGAFDGSTDKGAVFTFERRADRDRFVYALNSDRGLSVHADPL